MPIITAFFAAFDAKALNCTELLESYLPNISIVAISVGLPVTVNNPVPASQVGFQNSVQFNAFASKAAKNAVNVGTSVMNENF